MAERRARSTEEANDGPVMSLEKLRAYLAYDTDGISEEVTRHPELYEHVGQGLAQATARHDRLKYDLELEEARVAKAAREDAVGGEKKPTDKAIETEVAATGSVQLLKRKLLDAKAEVSQWAALKEAWTQRSYMLKESVSIYLARMTGSSSVTAPRDALAESNRERAGQLRQEEGFRRRRS